MRTTHPINVCRNLVPQVDTPLSPPLQGRGRSRSSEKTPLAGCSECKVWRKTAAQIKPETIEDYLSKTVTVEETPA